MSGVDISLDRSAIDDLLSSALAMNHLEVVGNAIVWQLREASPKRSGHLSRSWRTQAGRDAAGRPTVSVGTNVPYWHIPQYGSAEVTPTRYIDKAMSRAGVPYTPLPKG